MCVRERERESERDRREETVKEIVYPPQKSKDLSSFSNTQFVPNLYDYFLPWSTKGEILKTSFKKDTKAGSSKWMWIIKVVHLNWELNYIKCYIKKSIWHVIEQTEISVVRDSPHKNENCLHLLTLESFQTWIHFLSSACNQRVSGPIHFCSNFCLYSGSKESQIWNDMEGGLSYGLSF